MSPFLSVVNFNITQKEAQESIHMLFGDVYRGDMNLANPVTLELERKTCYASNL